MSNNTFRAPRGKSSVYSSMSVDAPAAPADKATVPDAPRVLTGHDIAELKPKHIINTHLGLEFYVPQAWQETKNANSVHMLDPQTGTNLQAHGMVRPGMSIEQWAGMRLPVINKERPHMEQVVRPHAFKAAEWESHTKGIIAEYRGCAPGDTEDTCIMICCACSDDMVISMVVTAKASVYEQQRTIYQWIFNRIEIGSPHTLARLAAESGTAYRFGQHSGSNSVEKRTLSVGNLASGQYLLNMAFLLYLILMLMGGYMGFSAKGGSIQEIQHLMSPEFLIAATLTSIAAVVMALYGLIRISFSGAWSWAYNLFNVVMFFIPGANLLSLFITNRRIISLLREEGYAVGWLGARAAIPDNNRDMRNVLILSVLLVTIPAAYPFMKSKFGRQLPESPIEVFTPPDQRFVINMPGAPKETPYTSPKGTSNARAYERISGNIVYMVVQYDLPIRPANVSDTMDHVRDSFSSSKKWKVLEETKIRIDGNIGRSLRLSIPEGKTQYLNHIIAGKTLFMVTAVTDNVEKDGAKIAAYLDSFHIN